MASLRGFLVSLSKTDALNTEMSVCSFGHMQGVLALAGGVCFLPPHLSIGGKSPSRVAAPGGLANRF